MRVPSGPPLSRISPSRPPSISTDAPSGVPRTRENMRQRATEAIEASASPRKPSVAM